MEGDYSGSVPSEWRVCVPPEGPAYYYHLPSGAVLWSLPPHIPVDSVQTFSEEDEEAVDDDELVPAEEAALLVSMASAGQPLPSPLSSTLPSPLQPQEATGEPTTVTLDGHTKDSADAPSPEPVNEDIPDFSFLQMLDLSRSLEEEGKVSAKYPPEWIAAYEACGSVCPLPPLYAQIHSNLTNGHAVVRSTASSWRARRTASSGVELGDIYYVNLLSGEQQWTKPSQYVEVEELSDVTELIERAPEGVSLSDLIALTGLCPASDAVNEDLETMDIAGRLLLDPTCAPDLKADRSVMHLFQSVLQCKSLTEIADSKSVAAREMWMEAFSHDNFALLRTLGMILINPVTPPAMASCCVSLLLFGSQFHPSALEQFFDGEVCEFPDALGMVLRGIRAAAMDRPLLQQLFSSKLGNSHAAVDSDALLLWLQFGTRLLSHVLHLSTGADAKKLAIGEESLDWKGWVISLFRIISYACAASSPRASTSGALSSGSITAMVADTVRVTSFLHRVFELYVLDDGSGEKPFGVISPVVHSLNIFSPSSAVFRPELLPLSTHVSAQLVNILTAAASHDSEGVGQGVPASEGRGTHQEVFFRDVQDAAVSFLSALLEFPETTNLLYTNDLNVLVDVVLRELQDLPVQDLFRISWLKLLRNILLHSQWGTRGADRRYRYADVCSTLANLFDLSAALASGLPAIVRGMAEQLLVSCRDVLEA